MFKSSFFASAAFPAAIKLDTDKGSTFSLIKKYVYEPNASIMKSGGFNEVSAQLKIDKLMHLNEYTRVFKSLTAFDAWYVTKDVFNEMNI